jgi:iron complex outermembrane receptor protein
MLKSVQLLVILLCVSPFMRGQVLDTIIELDPVTITASRVHVFAVGQVLQAADSLDAEESPGASAGDVISGMTSVHLRNYGAGTLTTASVRGTSANHTGLTWNGLRISPPNIGYVDLSTVRADFFENISLLLGGASPMFGSGSLGGSIHLTNQPVFGEGETAAKLGGSYGSFGHTDLRFRLLHSGSKMFSRTAAFYNGSSNDFPYTDLFGNRQKLDHGGFTSTGFIQEIALKLKKEQSLSALAWVQYADRDIPPTLTEAASGANQVDRSIRVMANWKDLIGQNSLEVKGAYYNDYIRYTDPRFEVYSTIRTQTAIAQLESTWSLFRETKVYAGTSYTFDFADLSAYGDRKYESALALFASVLQPVPSISWKFAVHLRQEFLTAFKSPFTFGISAEGKLGGPISMQASLSRNYRTPTMNERYWIPGGNPELSPEMSWNGDMSLLYQKNKGLSSFDIRITGFNSLVDEWILWVPGENYWSAENIRDVWARGLEIAGAQDVRFGTFRVVLKESYTYSHSTNENELHVNDASFKKQLIYTPVHKALVKVYLGWNGFGLTLRNTVTGEVFITRDNTSSLPGYYLLDLVLQKEMLVAGKVPVNISFNIDNILNEDYQVTPFRPMPGVNFLVSLSIEFSTNKKKE